MRRVGWLAAACLALTVPTARAADVTPPCEHLAVSATFSRDHTAFCFSATYNSGYVAYTETGLRVWMTYDGGRSWRPRSTLVTNEEQRGLLGYFFGAWYASSGDSRALFVATSSGLYVSEDNARTYHRVDRFATPPSSAHFAPYGASLPYLTPFFGTFAPAGGPALAGTLFAYAGNPAAVIDVTREAHVPVAGAGPGTRAFLLPKDFGTSGRGIALAGNPVANTPAESLYACPQALACPAKLASFPPDRYVDGLWLAPDYATSKRVWASHRPGPSRTGSNPGDVAVVESTDGGATLHTWQSVEKLLAPARANHATSLDVDVVAGPGRTVYLAMTAHIKGNDYPPVPRWQLFRSTDAGRTWTRRAYLTFGPRGSRGNLFQFGGWGPFNIAKGMFAVGDDGTVFGIGAGEGFATTVWCSRDGGAHWAKRCSK